MKKDVLIAAMTLGLIDAAIIGVIGVVIAVVTKISLFSLIPASVLTFAVASIIMYFKISNQEEKQA